MVVQAMKQETFTDIEYSFRHLLEAHGLNKLFFDAINRVMVQTGHRMKGGTIVDATIINAPSSTKKQLEAAGCTVDLQYAANDIATQVSQVENMIANGCEVLVIASIDGEALGTVLDQAKAANIPVIAYDRLIMNSDAVSYYATFDNWKVGVKQGEYIVEALDLANAGDKTYNIEYITGDPGDNNINFFFDGAISVLQPYIDAGTLVCPSGQTEKQTVATANWATDAAQARFETILGTYYTADQLSG